MTFLTDAHGVTMYSQAIKGEYSLTEEEAKAFVDSLTDEEVIFVKQFLDKLDKEKENKNGQDHV